MRRSSRAISRVGRRDRLTPIRKHPIIEHSFEHFQRGHRLVKRHLMARLVDAQEGEVAVLAHLAVLLAANHEGYIAGSCEFGLMLVLESQGDGLPAKPVAYVIGIAVKKCDTDAVGQNQLEVCQKLLVDEISGIVESCTNIYR